MHVHVKARCVIRKSKAVCSAKAAFKQPHDEFLDTYFRTERRARQRGELPWLMGTWQHNCRDAFLILGILLAS